MLLKLRDKVTGGKLAIVILILLAIPFAFFGIGNYFSVSGDSHVARIQLPGKWYSIGPIGRDVRDISEDMFRARVDQLRVQMRESLGDQYDGTMFDDPEVRRQILDQLIDEELMAIAAERDGLKVSNLQVASEIQAIPAFQVDGRFDPDQYRLVLASGSPPRTPSQFDALVRSELQRRMIFTQVGETAFATSADVEGFIRLRDQSRDVSYLAVPAPELDADAIDEAALADWFQDNQSRWMTEERVAIEYVEVRGSDIEPAAIDEQALRDLYEQQRGRFETAEQRLVSHILLTVDPGAGESSWSAVQARAQALREALDGDEAFEDLAREHSEDPGSSDAGGDLGWVEPGVFGDAFDAAVFQAAPGEVGEPVRTSDGWHLVLVREVREGESQAFEEVRDELEAELLATERQRAFSELAGSLMDEVYNDASSLTAAAEPVGLTVRSTGPFARSGGEGVAARREVISAAFSPALVDGGRISGAIELADDHIVVLQVVDRQRPEPIALDEVREEAESAYRTERETALAREAAEALLARAREGASLQELGEETGTQATRREDLDRFGIGVDRTIVEEAFGMARPDGDTRSLGLARMGQRNYALIELHGVTDGDPAAVPETEREQLLGQLGQARSDLESRAYLRALRSQYPVQIVESRLN
ncbi:MAG: SurA N-terminal domain-containing protein [Lysobacteraceae bacterium]